jgi:large subunit ribosomal protein L30e
MRYAMGRCARSLTHLLFCVFLFTPCAALSRCAAAACADRWCLFCGVPRSVEEGHGEYQLAYVEQLLLCGADRRCCALCDHSVRRLTVLALCLRSSRCAAVLLCCCAGLALVMKSGKYTLGYKSTLKTLRQGKAWLVIIADNCPPLKKSEIEYYAMLAKTGVHHYTGNNIDLGTACGKYFRVGCLSVTDPGDSDLAREMA